MFTNGGNKIQFSTLVLNPVLVFCVRKAAGWSN